MEHRIYSSFFRSSFFFSPLPPLSSSLSFSLSSFLFSRNNHSSNSIRIQLIYFPSTYNSHNTTTTLRWPLFVFYTRNPCRICRIRIWKGFGYIFPIAILIPNSLTQTVESGNLSFRDCTKKNSTRNKVMVNFQRIIYTQKCLRIMCIQQN